MKRKRLGLGTDQSGLKGKERKGGIYRYTKNLHFPITQTQIQKYVEKNNRKANK